MAQVLFYGVEFREKSMRPLFLQRQKRKQLKQPKHANKLCIPRFASRSEDYISHNDGTAAHYSSRDRRHLDNKSPRKWIRGGGPVYWSLRSPNLTPCEFFSVVTLKRKGICCSDRLC